MCKYDRVKKVDVTTYRSIVRSLMFLTNSRLVSRYMSDPYKLHLKETKRIMRYVKGITDFSIHYYKSDDVKLFGFSDSD